jgi:hypothetical protein
MIYFSNRDKARAFAKNGRKFIDLGSDVAKRWAVKVA